MTIRKEDIAGAPFHIGASVTVIQVVDNTTDEAYVGRTGEVVHYEYDCGCGQTFPGDPMIGVRFPDGIEEEFWTEELYWMTEHSKNEAPPSAGGYAPRMGTAREDLLRASIAWALADRKANAAGDELNRVDESCRIAGVELTLIRQPIALAYAAACEHEQACDEELRRVAKQIVAEIGL